MTYKCIDCLDRDAEISQLKLEIEELTLMNKKLQDQNESLIMDVAFYGGNLINLSCNDK